MYALCVSGAVNTRGFVWKFLSAIYKFSLIHDPDTAKIYNFLFMHSFIQDPNIQTYINLHSFKIQTRMHVFLSYVLNLMCKAVLCLELVFVELGQTHYK